MEKQNLEGDDECYADKFWITIELVGGSYSFCLLYSNKLSQKKLDKTLYELWKGRTPSYQFLKVWGCLAKVAVHIPKKVKI